jgi:lysozyme
MRKISMTGLESILNSEGLKLKEYKDSAGYPTIGVGHLLKPRELERGIIVIDGEDVPYSDGITKEQALSLLRQDASYAVDAVNRLVTVALTQNQFDALVSFTFNIGVGAFGFSTLLKRLNTGEYSSVPFEMRRWNKTGGKVSQGLINRREDEIKLWGGSPERRKGEINLVNDNGDTVSLKGNWSIK